MNLFSDGTPFSKFNCGEFEKLVNTATAAIVANVFNITEETWPMKEVITSEEKQKYKSR